MNPRSAIAMIGAAACLVAAALGPPAAAFTEVGDATALPPGQTASGSPLTSIDGSFASLGDVDLYRIDITNAASFSAETSATAGADTVLFLFDANGFAVAGNDDLTGGGPTDEYFSRLVGVAGLVNGTYLLSISRWPYFPVSAGGAMYSTDAVNEVLIPDQGVAYPTGPGGSQVLTGWAAAFSSNDPLDPPYTIAMTGVPEPKAKASCAAALASFAALGLVRRGR